MISNSSKYAIKALLCLAQSQNEDEDQYLRVEELSKRAKVPGPYLSKLLKELTRKKLVISRRGIKGGVRINSQLQSLTFYDVCAALGDPIINKFCFLSLTNCSASSPCPLHSRWGSVREGLHKFLRESKVL